MRIPGGATCGTSCRDRGSRELCSPAHSGLTLGSSCAHGPRPTSPAAEGALQDLKGHHLTQRPPNGHSTVRLPWASHVNGSCRLKVLPAAGTWKEGRSTGEQGFWGANARSRAGFHTGEEPGRWGAGILLGPTRSRLRAGKGAAWVPESPSGAQSRFRMPW